MRFARLQFIKNARRWIAIGLMLVYAIGSVGVVPSGIPEWVVRHASRAGRERYPCEDCACGCSSAHECWTRCCCHSEHQRLVWALRNGVTPPEDVHFSDEQWIAAANEVRAGAAHCSLCVTKLQQDLANGIALAGEPRAAVDTSMARGSCCETERAEHEACGSSCASERVVVRVSMSPLSCKNLQSMFVMALPPPLPAGAESLMPVVAVARVEEPAALLIAGRSLDIPTPPPRILPALG